MPAAAVANAGLVGEAMAVQVLFWSYFLLSAVLLHRVLRDSGPNDRGASIGWQASFIVMATLAPGFSFGQREYVSVLLAMPYLASATMRLQRIEGPDRLVYAGVGLLAGIGFAIKPFFLAVPLLVELWLVTRLGWRSIFRLESVVLAATVVVYLLALVVFTPQYLTFTLPLMRSIYWAFDSGNFDVVLARFWAITQPVLYGALVSLITRTWTRLHSVIVLAGVGYSFSYFIQAKGFVYHAYPVLVCSCVLVGICIGSGWQRAWVLRRTKSGPSPLVLMFVIVLLAVEPVKRVHDDIMHWYFQYNIAWGPTGMYRQAAISVVDRFAPSSRSYFFAFGTHPFPGFPSASYTKAEWTGRSSAQGILAATRGGTRSQIPN